MRKFARKNKSLLMAVTGVAALLLTAVLLATGIVLINREKDRTAEAYAQLKREQERTQEALAAEAKRRQQTREALDMLSSQVIDEWLSRQKELLQELPAKVKTEER